jgi:transposase
VSDKEVDRVEGGPVGAGGDDRRRQQAVANRAAFLRIGGDLAEGADGVLLSVQGMDVAQIAKVTFTSSDRVREVINNFNADGFDSLYPRYAGGRPPVFTLPQRQQIKKIALSRPADHGLPCSTWSLAKLAEFLVAEGVVDDISHEGLRELLVREEVSFQAVKTWKQSTDPDYEQKKNRVLELYDIAEGRPSRETEIRRSSSRWTSSARST